MGRPIPSILAPLYISDIKKDLAFMRDYEDAAFEIMVWEQDELVFSLDKSADMYSFKSLIHMAASIDAQVDLTSSMFSPTYQSLIAKHADILTSRQQYLTMRVDMFLSLVAKADKSSVLEEVIHTWDTVPMGEVRDMWRNELKRRAIPLKESDKKMIADYFEASIRWNLSRR